MLFKFKIVIFLFFLFFIFIPAQTKAESLISYQFGRGIKFKNCPLRFGGYFALKYESTDKDEYEFNIEDAAILIYGNLTDRTRFLSEIGAKELYVKKRELEDDEDDDDDDDDDEYEDEYDDDDIYIEEEKKLNIKPKIERLYLDYLINDYLKIRIGQFITPIGLWNPIHLPPLKWTLIDPITAIKFFPRLTTGLQVFGFLPFQNDSWEYAFFIQKTNNINDVYDNLKTDDFIGGEIRKYIGNFRLNLSLGKFKDKQIEKRLNFAGLSIDFLYRRLEIMFEYMYGKEEETNHSNANRSSYYIQGIYRVFSKNYLILRKEYFKEVYNSSKINVYLIGWNYRPLYPISLKLEVMWQKDDVIQETKREIAFSLAVLF